MPTKHSPGWYANTNGSNWELDIMDRLKRHGYEQWAEPPSLLKDKAFFVRQYRSDFRNPYGDTMKLDFYLYHPERHREGLVLECKYQGESGSTDEKLFFSCAAIKSTGLRGILMIMGSGFRRSAIDYCKSQQDNRFLVITSWDEFVRLFTTELL